MLDTTIAAGLSESWDFSWGITTCAFESEDALRLFFMPRRLSGRDLFIWIITGAAFWERLLHWQLRTR
jgi:hypothetical protein